MNKYAVVLESERNLFDSLPATVKRPSPAIDVFELFAGSAKFTMFAGNHHLNALQPMDWLHGPQQDLHDPALQQEIVAAVHRFKPWALIVGLDCRLWSIFNENLNYSNRRELLRQMRTHEKKLVKFVCELALL